MLAPNVLLGVDGLRAKCDERDHKRIAKEHQDSREYPWPLLIQNAAIPVKGESPYQAYAIVPHRGRDQDPPYRMFYSDLAAYESTLTDLKFYAPDSGAQAKYESTRRWITEVKGRFSNFEGYITPPKS